MPPRSDAAADAGHKACLLSCQGCTGLLCLHRASGGLLEEAPTPRPELVGPGNQWRIVLFGPARLALPTGGEPRFFEGPPAMLDRMARVCWKSGLRQDGVDRCGAAGCGVREGRGASEAAVCASLQTWPGLLPMFRRRFLGDPEAVMRVLADPHTMVRAQWGGASHVPRRRWGEGKPWPPPLLGRGPLHAHGIQPALARRLAHGPQEEHRKEERHGPETDPAHDREVAGPPAHAGAHRLGG